ncbi:uncharacterized protein LOC144101948 [Amblyomma americanum]
MQQQQPLKVHLRGAIDMIVASWWQVKAQTVSKCFRKAGFVRNAEVGADEESDVVDEAVSTDDVWSGLVEGNIVSATDTFEDYVSADENELVVCEEASTDDAIVAAVRSGVELATDDESDGEDDVDPMPDVPCKDALEYLSKVKMYCAKNSLSDKALQYLSLVEDEIVRTAVKKHRQTKITAFFRS